LSEELPKKRRRTEVLVSSKWQPWWPIGGTVSNNDLGFLTSGAIGIRICAYPRASGPGRLGRRASSSISTLPQMGWSKRTDSISLKASRRNLDWLRLPAPSPSPKATGAAF
jgi:hypothetical protein